MNRLPYDGDTGMFVQQPRPLNLNWLAFLRWLGERHLLEHEIAGDPCGPLVEQTRPAEAA